MRRGVSLVLCCLIVPGGCTNHHPPPPSAEKAEKAEKTEKPVPEALGLHGTEPIPPSPSSPPFPPGGAVGGGVIDSILPIPEAIERFRKRVGVIPERLAGEPSRDALVRRWITAVERADTLELARLLLSAGEYIAFYYPESPYTEPPYRQAPDIRWLLIQNGSDQGITRVLRRHGGRALGFQGYRCAARPDTVGRNRIWNECMVRFTEEGTAVERRLFGPILEREGRFKFLSYAADY